MRRAAARGAGKPPPLFPPLPPLPPPPSAAPPPLPTLQDAEALSTRSEAHLRNATRASAPVRGQLHQAVEMGAMAARDLATALGAVEQAVEAQRVAQRKLELSIGAEGQCEDDEVQHLAATLRDTIAQSRKAQRDGAKAQQTARSQVNTSSFQLSQAIAADRSNAGARPSSPRRSESAERKERPLAKDPQDVLQAPREPSPRRHTQRVR